MTFRGLRIDFAEHSGQLPEIVTDYRREAIRQIDFTVPLPEYGSEKCGLLESDEDKQRNNAVFTDSLKTFFQTPRLWKGDSAGDGKGSCRAGGRTLVIRAFSKSDTGNMEDEGEKRKRMELAKSGKTDDISATRFESSYLHLDGELPEVSVISELKVYGRNHWMSDDLACHPRFISGNAAARLMMSFPRLRRAHLQLSDGESRDMALREREREGGMILPTSALLSSLLTYLQGFARVLKSSSLQHLKLKYPGLMPENQENQPPPIPSIRGRDLLSANLGALSQQLVTLDLAGIFSNDLFSHELSWPHLQRLDLWTFMCTPAGDWMIEKDPEESDYELDAEPYEAVSDYMHDHQLPARIHYPKNPCRTLPRKDLVDEFFLAAGKAVARMLKLHCMIVLSEPSIFEFEYSSDGYSAGSVEWQTLSPSSPNPLTYKPCDEVIAAWKNAVSFRQGELEVLIRDAKSTRR